MAPEKDPQQFNDASNAKRKGKEIAMTVTKKIKDGNLTRSKSVAIEDEEVQQVDTDSSSESDIEFIEEDRDPWKRAALEYYQEVLSKQSTGWRKWPDQESAMIEIEVLESTIERVPNPEELPDEDACEEFVCDFEDDDEDADPDPTEVDPEQGVEEQESAQAPQEPQEVDPTDTSTNDAALVDALDVAADPSSSSSFSSSD